MADDMSETAAALTESAPEHNILTIPPELTERIVQCVDSEDLFNLRQTSRETEARILRTYGKAHFSCRNVLMCSIADLHLLLKIAESPLGRFLEEITLIVDNLPNPDSRDTTPRYDDIEARVSDIYGPEIAFLRRTQAQRLNEEYHKQEWSGELSTLRLTVAFCHLRHKKLHPIIEIADSKTRCRQSPTYRALVTETGVDLQCTLKHVTRYSNLIFDALVVSGLQVRELRSRLSSVGVPLYEMARHEQSRLRMSAAFAHLRTLDVLLEIGFENAEGDAARFVECLAHASQLKHLRVRTAAPEDQCDPGKPFLRHVFPALTSVDFANWTFECRELIYFLKLQPTLEWVRLWCCRLRLCERFAHLEGLENEELGYEVERMSGISTVYVDNCMVGEHEGTEGDEDDYAYQ